MKQKALFVVGPTASGKTAASIELALRLNGEIVSADSMAIYRGMDIGTAKPSIEERCGIPHHMINCVDPNQPYSVSEYQQDAQRCMRDIWSRNKLPIICGGTGLYVNSLIFPLDFSTVQGNEIIRRKWEAFAAQHGNLVLHDELRKVDPKAAEQIHPNNVRRVVRALEIFECTGIPKSDQASMAQPFELPYEPILMGITLPREQLYRRCDLRVEQMLSSGLEEEVCTLLSAGLSPKAQSMQGIGYKEIAAELSGELSRSEAINLLKKNTRHLAKRQLTWFRANDKIHWFDVSGYESFTDLYQEMMRYSLGNSAHP